MSLASSIARDLGPLAFSEGLDIETLLARLDLLKLDRDDESEEASKESSSELASQVESEWVGEWEADASESDAYSEDIRAAAIANDEMQENIELGVTTAARFIQEQLGKRYLKYGEKTAALEDYVREYLMAYCSFKTLDAPLNFCNKFACDAVAVGQYKGKYNIPRPKPKGKSYVDKSTQTKTTTYADKKTMTEADAGN